MRLTQIVAILMTLEGEYYFETLLQGNPSMDCRNPHDIGRRILRFDSCGRNNF